MTEARATEILNDLRESEYFNLLSAPALYEALCERMEESMSIEDSEMKTILGIIADRLGTLEEIEQALQKRGAMTCRSNPSRQWIEIDFRKLKDAQEMHRLLLMQ